LKPGKRCHFSWTIPDLSGLPIQSVGIEIQGKNGVSGTIYLDYLTWGGTPKTVLTRPQFENALWRKAWVDAVDYWDSKFKEPYRLVQNEGRGMIAQGTREWTDYQVKASVLSYLAESFGVAVHVQGLRRYYGLVLSKDGKARLEKVLDEVHVLKEVDFPVQFNVKYEVSLKVSGQRLQGWVDGKLLFDLTDDDHPLEGGAAALLIEEGTLLCEAVEVF
jgi:hypothetical protein